jgi:hypothetical protein
MAELCSSVVVTGRSEPPVAVRWRPPSEERAAGGARRRVGDRLLEERDELVGLGDRERQAIVAAIGVVRETDVALEDREVVLEEPGDALVVQAVHGRWLGRGPHGRMVVARLHFLDADTAHATVVLFTGLPTGPMAEGHMRRRGASWVVGHDLVASLARTAGVRVDPPAGA